MRILAVLVLAIAATSQAAPDGLSVLANLDAPVADRRTAAQALAASADVARRDELAWYYLITDDAPLRRTLVDMLIADGAMTAAQAAQVPTTARVARELRRLVRHPVVPIDARRCGVRVADASLHVRCRALRCERGCRDHRLEVELAIGRRWTLVSSKESTSDDGACGYCMFVE
ncbi:MAG: hypothetical protein K8W52_37420 [Deltaproteobacteria bacterium]|nr:hypothetical protein [Deltaproteobacteria bacterium]